MKDRFWFSVVSLIVIFVVLWLFLGLPDLIEDVSADHFNNKMQKGLDYAAASGTKLVTYDSDEDLYSSDYLPKELAAKKASEVGGVLNITRKFVKVAYTGGRYRDQEVIEAQLVQCKTGKVIASKKFEAVSPLTTSSYYAEDNVDEDDVMKWVSENWKN